jgi:hypothetical protein
MAEGADQSAYKRSDRVSGSCAIRCRRDGRLTSVGELGDYYTGPSSSRNEETSSAVGQEDEVSLRSVKDKVDIQVRLTFCWGNGEIKRGKRVQFGAITFSESDGRLLTRL